MRGSARPQSRARRGLGLWRASCWARRRSVRWPGPTCSRPRGWRRCRIRRFWDPNQRPFDRTPLLEAAARAMRSPAHPGAKAWRALTGDPIAVVRRGEQEAAQYLAQADDLITRQLRA